MRELSNFKMKAFLVGIVVLLVVGIILAYSRPIFFGADLSTYEVPPETEMTTYSPEEKASISAEFAGNVIRTGEIIFDKTTGSMLFNLAVIGVSRGIQFGKRLWRGDFIDGYHPDTAEPEAGSEGYSEIINYDFVLEKDFELAEVLRVADGDTLYVNVIASNAENSCCFNNTPQEAYVRLLGVNTPESEHAGKAVGYVDENYDTKPGDLASEYAKSVIEPGQLVYLQIDKEDKDKYDRLLRYVWIEEPVPGDAANSDAVQKKTLNAQLLKEGMAEITDYVEYKYKDLFSKLMEKAKAAKDGLWSITETMSAE